MGREAREAPARAVQPTCRVTGVGITAERADAGPLIARERKGELIADCSAAGSLKIDEECGADEFGMKQIGA